MAFVCFVVAATPKYIAATVLEFLITSLLLLLYMFKVNKKLTFFFWPLIVGDVLQHMQVLTNTIHVHFLKFVSSLFFSSLQDVFNSVFAAVYFIVLSLVALTTYTVTGTLVGGVRHISFSLIYNGNLSYVGPCSYVDFSLTLCCAVAQQYEV